MGADIHLFLEYLESEELSGWTALADGPLSVGRDYLLFEAIAGVRSVRGYQPKYPPRGIPKKASLAVLERLLYRVAGKDEDLSNTIWRPVSRKQATQWVTGGHSELYKGSDFFSDLDGTYVRDPNFTSVGWLFRQEVIDSISAAGLDITRAPKEVEVLLSIMHVLEQQYGERCARMVFWFDSE